MLICESLNNSESKRRRCRVSAFFCVVPVVAAGWPIFSAAATAAAAALGYKAIETMGESVVNAKSQGRAKESSVEIDLENSQPLAESLKRGESVKFEKGGVVALISKSVRGDVSLCVEGKGRSKTELEKAGKELLDMITQKYAYSKVVTELKKAGFSIANEIVGQEGEIRIQVRKWKG
jgi:hypothetical protein